MARGARMRSARMTSVLCIACCVCVCTGWVCCRDLFLSSVVVKWWSLCRQGIQAFRLRAKRRFQGPKGRVVVWIRRPGLRCA